MILSPDERYRFDLQGFLVRRGVLAPHEVARLHDEIDALGLPPAAESIQSQRFTGLLEAGGLLRDLMDHPAVLDIVRELCGPQVRLDHAYGITMAPGTAGLGLHGGGVPFDPAQYYLTDHDGIHTGLVAVQWAVSHHGPGEGGFCCVPGSHKARFARPAGMGLDHPLVREVPMMAGDVVVFTEALTHGTLPWSAEHERRSVLYKYSPGSSSWDRRPACSDTTLHSLTDQQRRLCQPPSVAWHDAV
jgi:hypothetical protein